MTLDDAIAYYDEVAEKCRRKANIERNDYMDLKDNASEAEQLADWLNELKLLRDRIEIQPEPCEDAVSRQGAIDAIVNRTVTVDTDAQWLSGHAQCELEIIDIINALPSVQQEPQWIPCSDCERRCKKWELSKILQE